MIITIDGPSGTGKSSVAKKLAILLGFTYFDTGAMFRTLAYGVLTYSIDYHNKERLEQFLAEYPVHLRVESDGVKYYLKDQDVTGAIRTPEITELSSKISAIKQVRAQLAAQQRELAQQTSCIFDGRDTGTVVFPQADLKIFLTADPKVRAKRRYLELTAKDPSYMETLTEETILNDMQLRDERDSTRAIAPLKAAPDAHLIDTTHMSLDEVVEVIISLV